MTAVGRIAAAAPTVASGIFNTDHGFTDKRIALTRKYLGWLRSIAPARNRPLQQN
jgi:hypothetical protein